MNEQYGEAQPLPSVADNRVVRRLRLSSLIFVFLWFFIGGIAHFALTATEMSIVPPYIPWPRGTVLITGVFELLGAIGLLYPPARRSAGAGLFALTIAVTPVHIYMLQRPELFHVPYWALVMRLPVQAALLGLIVWSSRGGLRNPRLCQDGGNHPD